MQNLPTVKVSTILGWQLRGQLILFIRASGLSDRYSGTTVRWRFAFTLVLNFCFVFVFVF